MDEVETLWTLDECPNCHKQQLVCMDIYAHCLHCDFDSRSGWARYHNLTQPCDPTP